MDTRSADVSPVDREMLIRVAARVWPGVMWSAERSPEGLTNSNWFIRLAGRAEPTYFVQQRVPEDIANAVGIDRLVQGAANEFAVKSGISPATVAVLSDESVVVTEFVPSTSFPGAGEERSAEIAEAARLLRRLHREPFSADVMNRMSSDVLLYVKDRADRLTRTGSVPSELAWAMATLERVRSVHTVGAPCVIHYDPRPGNFLRGERLFLIDWEYARVGDLYYDLGSFAYYVDLTVEEERHLVQSYFGLDADGAIHRIRLMRFVGALSEAIFGISMHRHAGAGGGFDYAAYAVDQLKAARDVVSNPDFERALDSLAPIPLINLQEETQ